MSASVRFRLAIACFVVAVGLVPATPAGAAALTEADAVAAFAPVVRLHPNEWLHPMNPGDFIARSTLNYARSLRGDARDIVGMGEIDAGRLGRGEYTYDGRRTNQHERPRDGSGNGFFLNLDNDARGGTPGRPVGAFYEFVPGRWLTYWFFYGYSHSEDPIAHEGDWERISIRLKSDNRPARVAFFQHDGACSLPWSDISTTAGSHPVVYSGLGDHASYHRVGIFKHTRNQGTDHTADGGRQWRTGDALYDATTRPWYGYGGAWGEVGHISSTTGPAGPKFQPLDPDSAFGGKRCA